ncbi:MAG: alanine dehydrogenase [Betaproteobacteria bacterium]
MIIGVPKEIKDGERRVALTPAAVASLVLAGHLLKMERGAGSGSGFVDAEYVAAGAEIVGGAVQAFDADLVVKVKEIQTDEWRLLNPGGMLFSFLHLGADAFMAHELLARRITGIAFETVEDASKRLAILAPMSVIAGELAIPIAANLLMTPHGGRGVTIADARVVILGAGSAGSAAARIALALGADVSVISRVGPRLAALAHKLGSSARTMAMHPVTLAEATRDADVVVGAVNVPGAATPKLLTHECMRAMSAHKGPGAVLVEICIDGGGVAATSRPTYHSAPTYVEEGVTHYCVANIPAAVPRSASLALSAAVLPYVAALAAKGLARALRDDDGLAAGLQIHAGQVTHPLIARELKRPHRDLDAMLFSC